MLYVFDTNVFQELKSYYPDRFPTFWSLFDGAVSEGNVVSVREVHRELPYRNIDDWVLEWTQRNSHIFLKPWPEETQFVGEIFRVAHFRNLIGARERLEGRAVADPLLIACARVREGCVVTQEKAKPNAAKIPNVCEHFDIRCIDFEGFLTEMDWSF